MGERDNSSIIDSKVGKDSEASICNTPNKKTKLYDTYNNTTTTTAIPSSSSSSSACTAPATSTTTNTQPSLVHTTTVPTTQLLSDTNTAVYYDRCPKNEASPSLHNNKNSDNTSKSSNSSSNNVCIQIDSIIDLTDD